MEHFTQAQDSVCPGTHASYWTAFLPGIAVMGLGMALAVAPLTTTVMNAVGPERAGLGSATTNTAREVGGVFGIALLGTILTTKLNAVFGPAISGLGLPPSAQTAIESTAGHGTLDPAQLAGLSPEQQGAVGDALVARHTHGAAHDHRSSPSRKRCAAAR